MVRLKLVGSALPVIVLSLTTFVFAYLYLANERPDPLVFFISEEHGTQVLNKSDINIREQEMAEFIYNFTKLYFNYDNKNMTEQIGEGTSYLTTELWENQERQKYENLLEQTKKIKVTEIGRLLSATPEEDDLYTWNLVLNSYVRRNGKEERKERRLKLKLVEDKRGPKHDRWGLKISELTRSL